MNERIKELEAQCWEARQYGPPWFDPEKFAELIVEECRNVVTEVYRTTALELSGPLLTVDEKIAEHFYGVE